MYVPGDIVDMKLVNKELYYRNNGIPQKKAMTYTKFTQDFHFNVSYGNLEFLSENQIRFEPHPHPASIPRI